jgi:hypothetical protein
MEDSLKIQQVDAVELMEASARAEYDVQIATAKKFPREVKRAVDNAIAIVTMDKETASSCGYALPRAGKNISGASVHLARILAAEWGNLRVEAKVVNITETQVVSQAVCFDLEKNYAVKVEVRKSIVGKRGRFTEDMITVTGNAANAIAYRNAVFAVIPKSVIDKAYKASRDLIVGDLSDEAKLIKKRKQILDGFKETYGVSESEVLKVMGLNTINQIKQDEIIQLIALAQAIKDGDTTVDEAFDRKSEDEKKAHEKSEQMAAKIKDAMNKKGLKKVGINNDKELEIKLEEAAKEVEKEQKELFKS